MGDIFHNLRLWACGNKVKEVRVIRNVTELLEEALALWRDCPETLPAFPHRFSAAEQAAREARMDEFLHLLEHELRRPPATRAERQAMHERLTGAFAEFGRTALNLEE